MDSAYTPENHRQCVESSQPLIKAVDDLYQCAVSKEFRNEASVRGSRRQCACHLPGPFIQNDRRQEPILLATRQVIDGVCRIIECSKILIVNSKEASLWQQLATHTKTVSEAIKRLATSVK